MLQELAQRMPPTSVVHALQARQLLQQLLHAVQVLDLHALLQLMQAMDAPLQSYAMGEQPLRKRPASCCSWLHAMPSAMCSPSASRRSLLRRSCLPATAR